jgi:hypothetical protein
VLFKKVLVVALSAVLALPVLGQQAVLESNEMPVPGFGPVTEFARLTAGPAPQPGSPAPQAQAQEAQEESAPVAAGKLEVEIISGEGAENNIATGSATPPKVRVLDEAGNPVENAEVIFQLPMGGPSGVFSGWVRTQTLRTDASGVASVSNYTPNEIEGQFNIKVTASQGNNRGSAVIPQSNVKIVQKKSHKTRWIIIGAIAAGAVVAIALAATGDDDKPSTTTNPVWITPGAISVGGPR